MAVRWPDDHPTVEVAEIGALRTWFEENHTAATGAWIWFWKSGSGRPSVSWGDVVDVLLCFGWIDTKIQQTAVLRKIYLTKRAETREKWAAISAERLASRIKPPY